MLTPEIQPIIKEFLDMLFQEADQNFYKRLAKVHHKALQKETKDDSSPKEPITVETA